LLNWALTIPTERVAVRAVSQAGTTRKLTPDAQTRVSGRLQACKHVDVELLSVTLPGFLIDSLSAAVAAPACILPQPASIKVLPTAIPRLV